MTGSYVYIFGRTPALAMEELCVFVSDASLLNPSVATSNTLIPIDRLGGTVKVAEVVDEISITPGSTFGISVYGGPRIPRDVLEHVKKQSGAHRFIEPKEGSALSSVVIKKNRVNEFIRVGDIVAKTIAVTDFEAWNRRDYGRPFADAKSGMLPPKVARMIVNIARRYSTSHDRMVLLDPFCGMGTILSEAALCGWNTIGSDQSKAVIEKARKNLDWLGAKNFQLFVSDATHVSQHIPPESVNAIVTEPFMGSTRGERREADVKNTLKGLEKLYIGCLRDWLGVLKPDGRIVMAFPEYHVGERRYFVKKVIDSCEMLGYTILAGPIEYSRPGAIVRRQFYVLKKITEYGAR